MLVRMKMLADSQTCDFFLFQIHVGSMAALGFSVFGVLFLSLMALLVSHGYPYVPPWFCPLRFVQWP